MDSNTHILVEKNGIEDEMNLTVWNAIGGDNNKDGWRRVPTAPVEVVEMKSKKTEAAPVEVVGEESATEAPVSNPIGVVKSKKGKK